MPKACGKDNAKYKHGYSSSRYYGLWEAMVQRCYNSNNKQFKDYGGRGIFVCNEWKESPGSFVSWCLAQNPDLKLTIERRNNNGPYSPDNCTFVTRKEQQRNRRANIWVDHQGERLLKTEFISKYGVVPPSTVYLRMSKGWSLKDAVLTPPRGLPSRCI